MSYLTTETRGGVRKRKYSAPTEEEARKFANLFSGYAYEEFPDEWRIII